MCVFPEPAPLSIALVYDHELDVLGMLMNTGKDFKSALELISSGAVEPSRFITHRFEMAKVEEAYGATINVSENPFRVMLEIRKEN